MRRTVWLLTITPLVALCITLFPSAVAQATGLLAGDTTSNAVAGEQGAMSVSSHNAIPDEQTLALQITATPSPSTTPSLVLPRLTPTVAATAQLSATIPLSATDALSTTLVVTGTGTTTTTGTVSRTQGLTTTTPVTATTVLTSSNVISDDTEVLDAEYAGPIEGTIIANRTDSNVRFFVEGATYELAPLRSIGLSLPRVTAVLNLFNCDALLPETQAGCFWDPYLLDREGFYEIISSEESGTAADLTLQPAGTPPGNQIWLQNRTGKREQIFYAGETYDLPPATVQEFATDEDDAVLFYLRSCLDVSGRSVCEWAPNEAEPGIYYALVEVTGNGAVPGSTSAALQLQALFSQEGTESPTPTPPAEVETAEAPPTVASALECRVDVPALNVRSGPGLQYQIVDKVRSSEQEPATITVIGRDAEAQWFALADTVVPNGWVTGSAGFVTCEGDPLALPPVEVVDGRLAPTPVTAAPTAVVEAPAAPQDPVAEATTEVIPETAVVTPTVAAQTLQDGQSLIVVNNGFEQQVRFTLDQRYRIVEGPSEYDLMPGQSVSLLVFPGPIAFSASSPWNALSGNVEFLLADKETRNLWVTFVPDPDGSGRWLLQY